MFRVPVYIVMDQVRIGPVMDQNGSIRYQTRALIQKKIRRGH